MTTFIGEQGQRITPAAYHALVAARMRQQVGRWAAQRYAVRHGSTVRLFTLACQLMAAQRAELEREQQQPLDFTQQQQLTATNSI